MVTHWELPAAAAHRPPGGSGYEASVLLSTRSPLPYPRAVLTNASRTSLTPCYAKSIPMVYFLEGVPSDEACTITPASRDDPSGVLQ